MKKINFVKLLCDTVGEKFFKSKVPQSHNFDYLDYDSFKENLSLAVLAAHGSDRLAREIEDHFRENSRVDLILTKAWESVYENGDTSDVEEFEDDVLFYVYDALIELSDIISIPINHDLITKICNAFLDHATVDSNEQQDKFVTMNDVVEMTERFRDIDFVKKICATNHIKGYAAITITFNSNKISIDDFRILVDKFIMSRDWKRIDESSQSTDVWYESQRFIAQLVVISPSKFGFNVWQK